jgi:hypothetical protein
VPLKRAGYDRRRQAALAAAWITWMEILHPSWTQRRWLVVIYFVGLIVLVWVLTARSPWFAFFTWIAFLYAFEYLPGVWRWVACVPVAVAFGAAQGGGFHRPTVGAVVILVVLASVDLALIGLFVQLGQKTEEQNQARKGMIAELAQANQRLEEMMTENTGLPGTASPRPAARSRRCGRKRWSTASCPTR